MGFSRSEAEKALSQCDGDLQRAATLLMDPPTAKPPPPPPPKPAPTPAFTEMVVELTAVQISDEFLPRLNGINGLAVAIDVLGVMRSRLPSPPQSMEVVWQADLQERLLHDCGALPWRVGQGVELD